MPEVSWPWAGNGVNSLEDDDNFGLADLGRLEQQYAIEPALFRELRHRAAQARDQIEAINTIKTQRPEMFANPQFNLAKRLAAAQKAKSSLEPRMALYKESTRERMNEQAVNVIGREYSERAINSYVNANSNSLEAQVAGSNAAYQGYGSLAEQRGSILNQMQGLRQESMTAAGEFMKNRGVNPAAQETLQGNAAQMKDLAQQLIPITVAMQQLKQQGQDPEGRRKSLINTGDKAQGVLAFNKLEEDMKSGKGLGAIGPAELRKKEADAAERLVKALDELRNSAGKSAAELEELNKNAEAAAKDFEEIGTARKMPGGGDRYASEKIIAGTVAEALGIITSAFQNIAINQPMQMVSNVTNAANMENEKYGMWHNAVSGNMQDRLSLGAWQTGHAFGDQQTGWLGLNAVHAAKMTSSGITTGLGVLQMGAGIAGSAGTVVGNNPVENTAQGAKSAISGAAGFIEEGAAWYRQTEKARLRVDATRAVVGASKALNYIPGRQLQGYRDYVMGLNETASQMGGTVGEDFLNQAGGSDFMQAMSVTGLGLKEMGTLSAQGVGMMGSMFRSNQVLGATQLENMGFGTADQNMRRMGILGAAGTADPMQNLGKLVEEGMQRGLNSSKAIDMIVENTARMTEETMRMGGSADPTDFLAKTILSAINKDNPNKEMAGSIAYQTYQAGEAARHNIATSFPGIINVDRNMKDMGLGTDRMSAALLTQIPTGMLNAFKGKSEDELKEFLEGRGINTKNMDPSMFSGGKLIDILNKNAGISELAQQSGVGYATGAPGSLVEEILNNKNNPWVMQAFRSGKNLNVLTDDQRNLRSGVAGGLALAGKNPEAVISDVMALLGIDQDRETNTSLADVDANGKSTKSAAQMEKRIGNTASVDQARQGGRLLGADAGGAEAIKALADTGREAFEKAGENAEEAWTTAASNTATNFGKSAELLNNASGKLDIVATKLIENTDAMKVVSESFGAVMKKYLNEITKKTDEVKAKAKIKIGH